MRAIYVRQSVENKDSISIESQIERCRAFAEEEEVRVYADRGYSGKNADRPQLAALLGDIEGGKISKVIIYKLDRISRRLLDFAEMMELFEHHGVGIVSCHEHIDTTTPMGRAMLNITMIFAQLERETIQQRVRDNYYDRARSGFYLGGRAPFGFCKIETTLGGRRTHTFEPDARQIDALKWMFREYAQTDITLGGLAKRLNSNGVTTSAGKPWSGASLGRLLRNPVYVRADADVYLFLKGRGATMNNDVSDYTGEHGCYVYAERSAFSAGKFTDLTGSFVTLALHRGAVPAAEWLRCQRRLSANAQLKNSGRGTHTWLSGLLKCAYCGYAISVVKGRGDGTYINCGGRKLHICRGRERVLSLSDIEGAVGVVLTERISVLNYVEKLASPENEKENAMRIRIVQLDEEADEYIRQLPHASEAVILRINAAVERLDAEKRRLLAKLREQSEKEPPPGDYAVEFSDFARDWEGCDMELRKKIARIFIERVTVSDDTIDVYFR